VILLPALASCTRDNRFQAISMWNESRLKPLEESPLAGTRSSSRPIPPGTIALGEPAPDDPVNTGRTAGKLAAVSPVPITQKVLERGQNRFNIYCSPCHSRVGDGNGAIVQRGFPHPPDYALVRLRNAPIGHFFDVMTNGYGVMYSYASRVDIQDRWAIASYIRVIQASRPPVTVDIYEAERAKARQMGGDNR